MTEEEIKNTQEEELQEPVADESVVSDSQTLRSECGTQSIADTETGAEEPAEEKDPLEAAKAEIEELKIQMLYKTAEFDNYRKRTLKEKAELILNGGEKAVSAVLPVIDDMERAIGYTTSSSRRWKVWVSRKSRRRMPTSTQTCTRP